MPNPRNLPRTLEDLGMTREQADQLDWRGAHDKPGAIQIANVPEPVRAAALGEGREERLFLMRVRDSDEPPMVYDDFELECFLDGVAKREFRLPEDLSSP